jgi:hypothetical protein
MGAVHGELFQSRFEIMIEHTDCFTSPELNSYRGGFNSAVIDHIDRKYGAGAFEKACGEVTRFRTDYYAAASRQVTQEVLDHLDEE